MRNSSSLSLSLPAPTLASSGELSSPDTVLPVDYSSEMRKFASKARENSWFQSLSDVGGAWMAHQFERLLFQLSSPSSPSIDVRTNIIDSLNFLRQVSWDKIHTGYWKDVPVEWRNSYSLSSLLLAFLKVQDGFDSFPEAVSLLDMSLIMGGEQHRETCINLATEFHKVCVRSTRLSSSLFGSPTSHKIASSLPEINLDLSRLPRRFYCPSLIEFSETICKANEPVIISGAMDHWPALNSNDWSNFEYLKSVAGYRTVPVELGVHYADQQWRQKLMTLKDFIDDHILDNDSGNVAYLAQTELFEQIPELKKDIVTPDYCYVGGADNPPAINAWFGPKDTVSPLHFDPKKNLFCQVVGRKYWRLYHPKYTEDLCPHEGKLLSNTSQIVDIYNYDSTKFADFEATPFFECIVEKGEMLFVPPKWWHYVRSLNTCFSVSFWFD